MRVLWSLVALTAVACGGGDRIPQPQVAADDSFPQPPPEPSPVKVDLLADVATVAPGTDARIGIRFSIRPGWKIYWSNPGEAGLPTVAAINAPAGFEVGAIEYPAPHSFEGPGGVRSYGYAKEVLLSAVVRAPAAVDLREVELSVDADWLACSDSCRRGRDRVALSLPVVPTADAVVATNRELFARHLTRVPVPLDLDACAIDADAATGTVTIDCAGAQALELFPASDCQTALTGQMTTASSSGARLQLSFRPGSMPERLNGVLRAEVAGSSHYYTCDQAISGLPAAPTDAAGS